MYPLKQVSRPQQEGEIPAELKVPDGEVLLFAAVGRGVQIYECTPSATDPSQSVWTFKEPHATLYDDEGNVVGIHYGGPTWQANDDSRVVGKVVAKATPDSSAIPWLLLEVASNEGRGLFSTITHIQRLYTVGGIAPADGCEQSHSNAEVRVDYEAVYYFYGPKVPDELKVPDGKVLLLAALGRGVQIYKCTPNATDPTQLGWTFKEPEAILFDGEGNVVSTHFAGPTWEAYDESRVVGKVVAKATPNPNAIPWLLLEAAPNEGNGLFSTVTHIQRLFTSGGLAPVDGCDLAHKNNEARVDYAAVYYFYGPQE